MVWGYVPFGGGVMCLRGGGPSLGVNININYCPPQDHKRSLGIVLLYGSTGWRFLISEVPLKGRGGAWEWGARGTCTIRVWRWARDSFMVWGYVPFGGGLCAYQGRVGTGGRAWECGSQGTKTRLSSSY